MGRLVLALVVLTACGRVNFDTACSESGFVVACDVVGGDDLSLDSGEYRYDTDAGTLTSPSGELIPHSSAVNAGVRIVSAGSVTISASATLRGFGLLPLAITAAEITIDGALDVSGRTGERGAGGEECDAGMRVGSVDGGGGGGGGGGGFGANGGDGGAGDSDDTGLPVGESIPGAGGPLVSELVRLRGGCDGSQGGAGDAPAGIGGPAAGGILLHAPRVLIGGVVRAHGGGGFGALNAAGISDGGGGGGASGGMIVVEATELILINGKLVANGGGGGEGGIGGAPGANGNPGLDAASPALGGGVGDPSDDGGAGGYRDSPDGKTPVGATPAGGGGGGGGSVGVIVIRVTLTNYAGSVVSPAPRS